MSEEIKEEIAPEEEQDKDAGKETASVEQEQKPATTKKSSGSKKWIFIIILGMILGISGFGILFKPEQFQFLMKKSFKTHEVKIDDNNLSEEILSPFFIPPGSSDDTIRIDLSIIWDGLASVRFRKRELSIRSMMYDKFNEIAGQYQDMNEKIPYIEDEVSSMLQNSLGVQNLKVKIKEIRYF